MIEIRKAEMNDAERLLQIYDYYVKNAGWMISKINLLD